MKILFQGDSITDAGRDKRNYHELGAGYPKFAAENIRADFPDTDFEFINFGISGNRTDQLFDRLYADGIAFEPDIISILIGINDVWHRHGAGRVETTDAQIETNYRAILERLKKQTDAKIVILCPFLLDSEDKESWRGEVEIAEGAIVAKRHIHMTPADAEELGVSDKEIVSVKLNTARPVIFEDVVVRVNPNFALAMHIDTDECNAAAAFGQVYGEIVK